MTLAQVAVAVGAELKWLQNASGILERPIRRSLDDTRMWALIYAIAAGLNVPLKAALDIARNALRGEHVGTQIAVDDPRIASIVVDMHRFESVFNANLSCARMLETPKQRGRPKQSSGNAIERAKAYGIDLSLLQSALNRPVRERLERLNANAEFLKQLRRPR